MTHKRKERVEQEKEKVADHHLDHQSTRGKVKERDVTSNARCKQSRTRTMSQKGWCGGRQRYLKRAADVKAARAPLPVGAGTDRRNAEVGVAKGAKRDATRKESPRAANARHPKRKAETTAARDTAQGEKKSPNVHRRSGDLEVLDGKRNLKEKGEKRGTMTKLDEAPMEPEVRRRDAIAGENQRGKWKLR